MNDSRTPSQTTEQTPAKEPMEVEITEGKTYWWCACGLSKTQPFCDGSHKHTAITPLRYRATETGKRWFCVCKRTATAPFCDGSHEKAST